MSSTPDRKQQTWLTMTKPTQSWQPIEAAVEAVEALLPIDDVPPVIAVVAAETTALLGGGQNIPTKYS